MNIDYLNYLAKYNKSIPGVYEFATRVQNFNYIQNYIDEHN